MHGIVRFHAESHLHEETHIMKLSMVLYEEQSFLMGRKIAIKVVNDFT